MDDAFRSAGDVIGQTFRGRLSPGQAELMADYTERIHEWFREPDRVPFDSLLDMVRSGRVRAQMRLYNLGDPAWRAFCEELVRRQHMRGTVFLADTGMTFTPDETRRSGDHVRVLQSGGKEMLEIAIGEDQRGNVLWPSENPEFQWNGTTTRAHPLAVRSDVSPAPDPDWDAWVELGRQNPEGQNT